MSSVEAPIAPAKTPLAPRHGRTAVGRLAVVPILTAIVLIWILFGVWDPEVPFAEEPLEPESPKRRHGNSCARSGAGPDHPSDRYVGGCGQRGRGDDHRPDADRFRRAGLARDRRRGCLRRGGRLRPGPVDHMDQDAGLSYHFRRLPDLGRCSVAAAAGDGPDQPVRHGSDFSRWILCRQVVELGDSCFSLSPASPSFAIFISPTPSRLDSRSRSEECRGADSDRSSRDGDRRRAHSIGITESRSPS